MLIMLCMFDACLVFSLGTLVYLLLMLVPVDHGNGDYLYRLTWGYKCVIVLRCVTRQQSFLHGCVQVALSLAWLR